MEKKAIFYVFVNSDGNYIVVDDESEDESEDEKESEKDDEDEEDEKPVISEHTKTTNSIRKKIKPHFFTGIKQKFDPKTEQKRREAVDALLKEGPFSKKSKKSKKFFPDHDFHKSITFPKGESPLILNIKEGISDVFITLKSALYPGYLYRGSITPDYSHISNEIPLDYDAGKYAHYGMTPKMSDLGSLMGGFGLIRDPKRARIVPDSISVEEKERMRKETIIDIITMIESKKCDIKIVGTDDINIVLFCRLDHISLILTETRKKVKKVKMTEAERLFKKYYAKKDEPLKQYKFYLQKNKC